MFLDGCLHSQWVTSQEGTLSLGTRCLRAAYQLLALYLQGEVILSLEAAHGKQDFERCPRPKLDSLKSNGHRTEKDYYLPCSGYCIFINAAQNL